MVPFGQMATGRKRPVEEDLLSENHDAKNLKLRAHVGGIALNMLASCSSPWIQYDSAFRNQCMPGGMVPQYLGAGGAASLPLLMGCDSLQQCAAGMRAGHSLGVSSCDSSHRLSVDVQMQQQGSNRPGTALPVRVVICLCVSRFYNTDIVDLQLKAWCASFADS